MSATCIILIVAVLLVIALAFVAGTRPLKTEKSLAALKKDFISPFEADLIRIAFDKTKTQADLDRMIEGLDADSTPLGIWLLIKYVTSCRTDLSITENPLLRIRGAEVFCGMKAQRLEGHLSHLANSLNEKNIPFVVLKGGAMSLYRPEMVRWMTDIDLMVKESDYASTVQTAVSLGFGDPMECSHSTDLHAPGEKEGALDIHRSLELGSGREAVIGDSLIARGRPTRLNGGSADCIIPCPEDMVFVTMVNNFKNIMKRRSKESLIASFFDIPYLVSRSEGFSWDAVWQRGHETDSTFHLLLCAQLMDAYLPDIFPREWVERRLDKEFEPELIDFFFHRNILSQTRQKMEDTGAKQALQGDITLRVKLWGMAVSAAKKVFGGTAMKRLALRFKKNG